MTAQPISRLAVAAVLAILFLQGLFVVALFNFPAGVIGVMLALAMFIWAHRYAKSEALGAGSLGRDAHYYSVLADRIGVIQLGAVMLALFSLMAIISDLGASPVVTTIIVGAMGATYLIYMMFAIINPHEKGLFESLAGNVKPPESN
jgi:hypothetical protein